MKLDIQRFALSNTFYTNEPSGRMYKVVTTATQNSTYNYSYITAKVYARNSGVNTYFNSWAIVDLTIDGTTYDLYKTSSIYLPKSDNYVLLFTQSKTVYHNSAGYKTLAVSLFAGSDTIINEDFINYSGSSSFALDRILRYTTITTFSGVGAATSIDVTWGTPDACDLVQYSINGGAWTDGYGYPTFTISGLSAGTQYGVRIRVRRTDSQLFTESGTIYVSTLGYATITAFTTDTITLESFHFNVSTDYAIDYTQHSLNGGAWTDSGNQIISGLTPNTQYSLKCRVKRTDSQLWTESWLVYPTTLNYATLTYVPDGITMGNDVAVTYSNPSGSTMNISIYKADNTTPIADYRVCTGTTYTFDFTNDEINAMYAAIPTTNSIVLAFHLRTTYNGHYYYSAVERTFNLTSANPTFTDFTYEDTNATTKAITKVDTTMIKGYSTPKMTVSTANKMVAIKGATATSYSFESTGIASKSKAYSGVTEVNETLAAIQNASLTVKAVDSRGNQTAVSKTPILIDYSIPVFTAASIERADKVGAITTLTITGTYTNWTGTYTDLANSIQTAQYRYKEAGGAWSDYIAITLDTNTAGAFTFTDPIDGDLAAHDGFDTAKSYAIEVQVIDRLATVTSPTITLNSAQPLLWKLKTLTGGVIKSILGIGKKPDSTLPHGSIDILGDAVVGRTLKVKDGHIESAYQYGSMGGQIQLNKPASGTAMTNKAVIEVADNRLRLYQNVSPYYGAYLPLTSGGAVDSTKILTTADQVVLYNNATGTTGTITLSETSANFSYLEIYGYSAYEYAFTKVYSPNGKAVILSTVVYADQAYFFATRLAISGTSITQAYNKNWYGSVTTDNSVYVTRVIGYR